MGVEKDRVWFLDLLHISVALPCFCTWSKFWFRQKAWFGVVTAPTLSKMWHIYLLLTLSLVELLHNVNPWALCARGQYNALCERGGGEWWADILLSCPLLTGWPSWPTGPHLQKRTSKVKSLGFPRRWQQSTKPSKVVFWEPQALPSWSWFWPKLLFFKQELASWWVLYVNQT